MAKDTYIPRNEVIDINREFNKVRKKAEKELLKIPGVVSVGVGLKEIKGKIERLPCFKVTVMKKKPESRIKSRELIPDTIFGFPTDINELSIGTETSDDNHYRPLIGGCKIGTNSNGGSGTLGCLARRNNDNKIVILSNWHVLASDPDHLNNERVGQPSHNGCCTCCACNEIAYVVLGFYKTKDMDAAIALLHGQDTDVIPDFKYVNEILGLGLVAGSAAPQAMETVYKYGFTTGLTRGQIINDNQTSNITSGFDSSLTIQRHGQLEIESLDPPAKFTEPGDSGSAVLNEENQVVGLHYGKSGAGTSYSTPITTILHELNISIIDSTFPTTADKQGVPLSSTAPPPPAINTLAETFETLEKELGQLEESKNLLGLFKQHREELLYLVNNNRETMAAWNRYQGPAYLAHIARSIRREKPIPEQVKGITLQNLVLKMTAVLQRNGSPELASAVTDNYLQIMNILASGRTPQEWKERLNKKQLTTI